MNEYTSKYYTNLTSLENNLRMNIDAQVAEQVYIFAYSGNCLSTAKQSQKAPVCAI